MKIGIDIGGSHVSSAIVLEDGTLKSKQYTDTRINKDTEKEDIVVFLIDTINTQIETMLEENKKNKDDIKVIGISVPGNPIGTTIRNLVNLKIDSFDIGEKLKEFYDAKIIVKNDARCAGLAEKKYGSLKEYEDCIFICIGTGVGASVFLDNKILKSKSANAFEIGHMIINKNGRKCKCGSNGCFERYASMKRMKKDAKKELNLNKNIRSKDLQLYIREHKDEKEVKEFVDRYLSNVLIGITNIVNIFEVEAISFGGSFSYYGDIFLPILEEKLQKSRFNKHNHTKLLTAELKNNAGIIGAVIED